VIDVSSPHCNMSHKTLGHDADGVGRKNMIGGVDCADYAVADTGAGGGKDAVNRPDRVNWLRRGPPDKEPERE
jgi:hypothetical protein